MIDQRELDILGHLHVPMGDINIGDIVFNERAMLIAKNIFSSVKDIELPKYCEWSVSEKHNGSSGTSYTINLHERGGDHQHLVSEKMLRTNYFKLGYQKPIINL